MGSPQTIEPESPFIKVPLTYPKMPAPGKLELLWDINNKSLYHKLSPYNDYNEGLIPGLIKNQPFLYTYPDQSNTFPTSVLKYDSFSYPLGSATLDVIRVSKFLASGRGITFLAKQALLQTGNPYNETRVYNPTSPVVAAGMTLALGAVRPQRNFDTSAGLGGIVSTLIGSAIPDAIFGDPQINPPAGTVSSALPDATLTIGGKGLLRAGDANRALGNLQSSWPQNTKGSSINISFSSVASNLATSLFANFIPDNQSGIQVRSDEGAYGLMVGGGSLKFSYNSAGGTVFGFGQRWIAGSNTIRKSGQYPSSPYRLFIDQNGQPLQISNNNITSIIIPGVGSVGYTIAESTNTLNPGFRYGDSLGTKVDGDYESSDIMVQYNSFVQTSNNYPTKNTLLDEVTDLNATLTNVLNDLKNASGGIYSIAVPNNSKVISSGQATLNGYDRLFVTNKAAVSPLNYPKGLLQDYRNVRVVDNSITLNPVQSSLKLPGAGNFDAINTLTVLPKDKSIPSSKLKGWTTWQPYVDDQIALYFYDVVNEKYIPFRAAIQGLVETANATWEEMVFIGRADKIYSYGGFNRTLAMTINITISSLAELAPTWQRINYLTTLVKPSNYTTATLNQVTDRFMIPPMVMLTVGDMYKEQPVLIQSITTTVPDDASWETSNEFNSPQGWQYLATYLNSPNAVYGQLPRTVDIALGLILLEKERAIAGGANFGNAPRTDDWKYWKTDIANGIGSPNILNQSLVVPQDRAIGTKIFSKPNVSPEVLNQ